MCRGRTHGLISTFMRRAKNRVEHSVVRVEKTRRNIVKYVKTRPNFELPRVFMAIISTFLRRIILVFYILRRVFDACVENFPKFAQRRKKSRRKRVLALFTAWTF